jgi:hypothetical protein
MHNIDVYMEPLIKELQVLWRGVVAYDVAKVEGKNHFILQMMLMWTIHDYPPYGLVARCVHQGYKACPICRPNFTSRHSLELGKVVYEGCQEVTHIKRTKIPTTLVAKKRLEMGHNQ